MAMTKDDKFWERKVKFKRYFSTTMGRTYGLWNSDHAAREKLMDFRDI